MSKRYTKNFFDFIVTIFVLLVKIILSVVPLKISRIIFKWIGSFGYIISKKSRETALENLRYAFPEYTEEQRRLIAKQSFQNLMITMGELFIMHRMSDEKLKEIVKFKNLDVVEKAKAKNKSILFLSAHYGNWELLAYSVGYFTQTPLTIVVKPQSNKYLDKILNKIRTHRNNKVVSMYSAAKVIVEQAQSNGAVALLADQSATKDKDVFVDFFNRPAATYKVVAKLALCFGITIITTHISRQPDMNYVIDFKELDYSDLSNTQDDIKELTQRHVKAIEDVIRTNPGQWTWMHHRWKHTPKSNQGNNI